MKKDNDMLIVSEPKHGTTLSRWLFAEEYFRNNPSISASKLSRVVKKNFHGLGINTQIVAMIVKGMSLPTPMSNITSPITPYNKRSRRNVVKQVQTVANSAKVVKPVKEVPAEKPSLLEVAVKLGAVEVTLPDGTVVRFK